MSEIRLINKYKFTISKHLNVFKIYSCFIRFKKNKCEKKYNEPETVGLVDVTLKYNKI